MVERLIRGSIMNLTKAIEKQESEIASLEIDINILLSFGDKKSIELALKKEKRKELLIRQINLAKVL